MNLIGPCATTLLIGTLLLSSCAPVLNTAAQPGREQDTRVFTAALPTTPSIAGATLYKGLYAGEHGQASYLIEVPEKWNGKLVMYAHGYAGMGAALTVSPPALREYLVSLGYAWAASSYSSNYYDVRSGIEDTNALAQQFAALTQGKYAAPTATYIMGVSMGGNVAAAAVEAETLATARHKVNYAASMPLCAVLDPPYEFQWLGDYTLNAQELGGYGPSTSPASGFQTLLPDIKAGLFSDSSGDLWTPNTVQGTRLRDIALNLTGGPRPVFDLGFRVGALQDAVLSTGGSDGTLSGILTKNSYGNQGAVYRWTQGDTPTPAEVAYNQAVLRTTADPSANLPRADGLRWLPAIHAQFKVPVLTMHTLGDFYVPFAHEQHYLKMAQQNGTSGLLVQRAIRAAGHCEFVGPELVEAFNDWMKWASGGPKPAGDDVMTPGVVADTKYGCQFTRTTRPGVDPCTP
ncbi:alpha/beta hydrolase [Deinococcus rubellus]|uniref:alpha/beta hydrolase n=1 Tax=Deinococcus rubellus TaxID=1889240 RepID=UPI0031E7307E